MTCRTFNICGCQLESDENCNHACKRSTVRFRLWLPKPLSTLPYPQVAPPHPSANRHFFIKFSLPPLIGKVLGVEKEGTEAFLRVTIKSLETAVSPSSPAFVCLFVSEENIQQANICWSMSTWCSLLWRRAMLEALEVKTYVSFVSY